MCAGTQRERADPNTTGRQSPVQTFNIIITAAVQSTKNIKRTNTTKKPMAQSTTQNNDTTPEEEQAQQSSQEDQPRVITKKKKYLAEGWEFFDAYRKKDTTNTTQAPSKNGGNDKTNTKTPAPAKNGKPTCDNKKAAAK